MWYNKYMAYAHIGKVRIPADVSKQYTDVLMHARYDMSSLNDINLNLGLANAKIVGVDQVDSVFYAYIMSKKGTSVWSNDKQIDLELPLTDLSIQEPYLIAA